jgi:hypothetical protein
VIAIWKMYFEGRCIDRYVLAGRTRRRSSRRKRSEVAEREKQLLRLKISAEECKKVYYNGPPSEEVKCFSNEALRLC